MRRLLAAVALIGVGGCNPVHLPDLPMAALSGRPWAQCNPDRVSKNEKFDLALSPEHPSNLAVRTPKGDLYLVIFEQRKRDSTMQPLMSAAAFQDMTALQIDTKTFVGIAQTGPASPSLIFGEPGIYEILVAGTFETEEPDVQGRCTVRYRS